MSKEKTTNALKHKDTILDKVVNDIPVVGEFTKKSPVSPTLIAGGFLALMFIISGIWSVIVSALAGFSFVKLMTGGWKKKVKQIGSFLIFILWFLLV